MGRQKMIEILGITNAVLTVFMILFFLSGTLEGEPKKGFNPGE